ncbi:MAG TPA: G1 family glutamic endopeptidase [Gaiellaceae bacterium]
MRVLLAFILLTVGATAGGTATASSTTHTFGARAVTVNPEISSNWSGYAAISSDPEVQAQFTDVTATWRVPKSTCTVDRISSAAFWVGLGGYDPDSSSLEQLGTGADCDGATRLPTYYAWWELVPAASVRIPLKINAGDTISAAVLVNGPKLSFSLKDLTRHTRFSKVLTPTQALDTASAEWIAEAPSNCSISGHCQPVPLTNFGTVTFSNIAAIGDTHPGTLTDAAWTASAIELISSGSTGRLFGLGDPLGDGIGALPGEASTDGRTFSVSWQRNLTPG